jgi:hypothetical protein
MGECLDLGEKINGSVYKMRIINLYPTQDIVRMIKSRGSRTYGGGKNPCKIVVRSLEGNKYHSTVTDAGGRIILN